MDIGAPVHSPRGVALLQQKTSGQIRHGTGEPKVLLAGFGPYGSADQPASRAVNAVLTAPLREATPLQG